MQVDISSKEKSDPFHNFSETVETFIKFKFLLPICKSLTNNEARTQYDQLKLAVSSKIVVVLPGVSLHDDLCACVGSTGFLLDVVPVQLVVDFFDVIWVNNR